MSLYKRNIRLVVMMVLPAVCHLGKVTLTTEGTGSFVNLIEKGVVVAGKSSIIFSLKACASAAIVVSDIMGIKDTVGNYFLLMIGSPNSNVITGQDSCFRCNRTKTATAKVLDCDTMKDFWIRWDDTGVFETGPGTAVGVNTLLTLKGRKDTYKVNTAAITSMNGVQALWQFTSEDLTTTFLQPVPSGSTVVEISETAPVGSDVLDIVLNPPNENTTFGLNGETSDMFFVNKTKIKLAKSLDYEMKQFHTLSISTSSGLTASMTVVVVNAIDEIPQVNASDLVIPEELPVGTVIGWNLTVFDPDKNDTLSYKIEGAMSDLLSILPNGNLQVTKRIDRDTMDISNIASNLTVTVSDAKPHNVTVTVLVEIKDINDNRPQFNQTIYRAETREQTANDISILALSAWDVDDGGNGQVNLSILEGGTSFYLKNSTLYVKAGQLDYDRTSSNQEIVIVQAVDLPDSGLSQSETTIVLVHVLQRNAQPFSWLSPASDGQGRFKEIVMSSSTPPGSTVTKFEVASANSTVIQYSVTSNYSTEFNLNPHTGVLKTRSKFEKSSYAIKVSATSGNISISGTLRVVVKKAEHSNHTVRFDRSMYIVSKPGMWDEGKSLTNIRILAPNASAINISMDKEGRKAFALKGKNNSWSLFARQGVVSIPSVVQLTAKGLNGTNRDTSFVVVNGVFTMDGTHTPTHYQSSQTSANTRLCPTQSSTKMATATEEQHTITSTTVTTTTTTTTVPPAKLTVSTHQSNMGFYSTTMRECPPPSRTKEVAFISVIAIQGLTVAALLGLHVFKTLKRKKQNVIEPERRDPLGCEPERSNSSRKGNIPNEDTILEIEDETKNRNHIYSMSGKEKTLDNLSRNCLKDANSEKEVLASQDCIEVGKDCLEDTKSTHGSNCDGDEKAPVTPHAAVPEEKQIYPDEEKRCRSKVREPVADDPSETPNRGLECHDDLNASDDAGSKADIGQTEIQNEELMESDRDKTDSKPILTDDDINITDGILNQDMITFESHVDVGNNIDEPLRPNTKGTLDGEKPDELWNLEGLTPAYSSHLTRNALRTPESPKEDERNASAYAESTVNETVALSDFIAQDEDFDYTISRVEEGNRATLDDTLVTPVNIDSLPNFNLHHMYNRVQTSPLEEALPSSTPQGHVEVKCSTSDEKEQKRFVNNSDMNRQNVQTNVPGQARAIGTIGSPQGAGVQHTVLPHTGQPCPDTTDKIPKHNTGGTDHGVSSSDDDDEEDEEGEKVVRESGPVGNGTTYIPSQTVSVLNTESVKQDVIKRQNQHIPVEAAPPETSKSKKNGKKKKGEKKGKSKKKGASKKKSKKGKGK